MSKDPLHPVKDHLSVLSPATVVTAHIGKLSYYFTAEPPIGRRADQGQIIRIADIRNYWRRVDGRRLEM